MFKSKLRDTVEIIWICLIGIMFAGILGMAGYALFEELFIPEPKEIVPPAPKWDLGKIEVYKYIYDSSALVVLEVTPHRNSEQTLFLRIDKEFLLISDPSTNETRKVDLHSGGWNIYTREESVMDRTHKIVLELIQGETHVIEEQQDG